MQMICALLIFQTEELPGALPELSPWLDRLLRSARTKCSPGSPRSSTAGSSRPHTPLDGIPIDPRRDLHRGGQATRLDMAVSLYHQGQQHRPGPAAAAPPASPSPASRRHPPPGPLHDWLISWIHEDTTPQQQMDSLPGVMWQPSPTPGRGATSRTSCSCHYPGPVRRSRRGNAPPSRDASRSSVPPQIWPQPRGGGHVPVHAAQRRAADRAARDHQGRQGVLSAAVPRGPAARSFARLSWADYRRRVDPAGPAGTCSAGFTGTATPVRDRRWARPGTGYGRTGKSGRVDGNGELIRRTARYPLTGSRPASSPSANDPGAGRIDIGSGGDGRTCQLHPRRAAGSPPSAAAPRSDVDILTPRAGPSRRRSGWHCGAEESPGRQR